MLDASTSSSFIGTLPVLDFGTYGRLLEIHSPVSPYGTCPQLLYEAKAWIPVSQLCLHTMPANLCTVCI